MRFGGLAVTALLAVGGCGQSPEQVVTGTIHCSGVQVAPSLLMRLSSYTGHPDSIPLWVVQACHPTGTACLPILTYDHAPPPLYDMRGQTLVVRLLGGREPRVHNASVKMGGEEYAITIQRYTGDVGAFLELVEHRCPPPNRQYPE